MSEMPYCFEDIHHELVFNRLVVSCVDHSSNKTSFRASHMPYMFNNIHLVLIKIQCQGPNTIEHGPALTGVASCGDFMDRWYTVGCIRGYETILEPRPALPTSLETPARSKVIVT